MGSTLEKVADGVHRLAGDIKNGMNVYFIEDEDGITQFDAGTQPMTDDVREAGAKLGGLKRIVLGHSHSDHRGTAPALGVPVFCHPDEVEFATAEEGGIPDYWDMDDIDWWVSRWLYKGVLHRRWDAGAVKIADTIEEGDEVAGFKVFHFPGHAPGLIGLWRESDRLMLSTDTIYMVDSIRLKALPGRGVPDSPTPGLELGHRGGEGIGAKDGRARAAHGVDRP